MNLNPFLYRDRGKVTELYVGGCETIDAMRLFDVKEPLSIICLGATLYKDFGWATESDIPTVETIGEFIDFLDSEGDIGIVEFEANIGDIVKLSTHDDGECNFIFQSKSHCIDKLKAMLKTEYVDFYINKLMNNQGLYLELLEDGSVKKYSNFEEYIRKNA